MVQITQTRLFFYCHYTIHTSSLDIHIYEDLFTYVKSTSNISLNYQHQILEKKIVYLLFQCVLKHVKISLYSFMRLYSVALVVLATNQWFRGSHNPLGVRH